MVRARLVKKEKKSGKVADKRGARMKKAFFFFCCLKPAATLTFPTPESCRLVRRLLGHRHA